MKLINTDIPIISAEENVMDHYINSYIALEEALNDINVEDALDNDLDMLNEIKNHIDKFGVSEETLSLFSNDLKAFNITSDTSKEIANEILENIIDGNRVQISEEFIITALAWILSYHGAKVALLVLGGLLSYAIINKVTGISIIKSFKNLIASFVEFVEKTSISLKKVEQNINKQGFNPFEDKQYRLHILPKDQFEKKVKACENINDFLIKLNPMDVITTNFQQKESLLKDLGYFIVGGKIKEDKKVYPTIILSENGYTKDNIKSLVSRGMDVCKSSEKFNNIIHNLEVSLRKMKASKEKPSDTEITQKEKELSKIRVSEYKQFIQIAIKETKDLLTKIMSLSTKTVE